mmetsp:Transcript_12882/g.40670  ORF Transcript_12882/g.40670 Transcript_12882/m.40670 type:complete len:212 (+) Transcript_12882:833-1468(+)
MAEMLLTARSSTSPSCGDTAALLSHELAGGYAWMETEVVPVHETRAATVAGARCCRRKVRMWYASCGWRVTVCATGVDASHTSTSAEGQVTPTAGGTQRHAWSDGARDAGGVRDRATSVLVATTTTSRIATTTLRWERGNALQTPPTVRRKRDALTSGTNAGTLDPCRVRSTAHAIETLASSATEHQRKAASLAGLRLPADRVTGPTTSDK